MDDHASDHDHDHDHNNDHAQPRAEIGQSDRPGYYDVMETALRELLIEQRLFGADEIRRQIEVWILERQRLAAW